MSSRQGGKDAADKNERYSQRKRPRKKVCQFCQEKATHIDYKDLGKLKKYTTERGKIFAPTDHIIKVSSNIAWHGDKNILMRKMLLLSTS